MRDGRELLGSCCLRMQLAATGWLHTRPPCLSMLAQRLRPLSRGSKKLASAVKLVWLQPRRRDDAVEREEGAAVPQQQKLAVLLRVGWFSLTIGCVQVWGIPPAVWLRSLQS